MADRSVTVKLKIDIKDFSAGLAQAAAQAEAFRRSLSDSSSGDLADGLDRAADSSDHLGESMDSTASSSDGLSDSLGENRNQMSLFGEQSKASYEQLGLFDEMVHTSNDDLDEYMGSLGEARDANDEFDASVRKSTAATKDFNNSNEKASRSIDRTADRMSILIQAGLALGPALVPVSAALIPAIAGIGEAMLFAGVAAGTTMLAFSGVGTGLKALNNYQLQPTQAHFDAMRIAMEKLGPAGQNFVAFLQDVRPDFQKLQDIAQEGMLPGVQAGMEAMMTQMPLVQQVIGNTADALGSLAERGGEAFKGQFWTDFMTFVRDESGPMLTNLGEGMGHLAEGIAALLMDFGNLGGDFLGDLNGKLADFSDWAKNLPDTSSFQDFILYVREAGPKVAEALGAISDAFTALVTASADVGLNSLTVITKVMQVLAGLANSPLGPWLIGAAAGFSALSLSMTLATKATTGALAGQLAAISKVVMGAGFIGGLKNTATALQGIGLMNGARIAAGIGLIASSLTDLDDKAGISGTIQGTLLGTMIAPGIGTAIGAFAGAMLDATKANDAFDDSLARFNDTMTNDPLNFDQMGTQFTELQTQASAAKDKIDNAWGSGGWDLSAGLAWSKNALEGFFATSDVEEMDNREKEAKAALDDWQNASRQAANDLNGDNFQTGFSDFDSSMDGITQTLERAAPALDSLNISMHDFIALREAANAPDASGEDILYYNDLIDRIGAFEEAAASVEGRSQAVVDAFAGIGEAGVLAADSASALAAALDALIGPEQGATAAADAWAQGLADLAGDLNANSKTLVGNTQAARDNRAVLSDRVDLLKANLTAEANAGAGSKELARSYANQTKALMAHAVAAGMDRGQVKAMLAQWNITPKLTRMILKTVGVSEAENDARNLADAYNKLPKSVRVAVAEAGAKGAKVDIDALTESAHLTPKQVAILTKVINQADAPLDHTKAKASDLDGTTATIITKANDLASGIIASVSGSLAALDGRTANTYLYNHTINTIETITMGIFGGGKHGASGGLITGPGGPRDDLIPAMLSNGEFVVNAAATRQNLAALHQMNTQQFHAGGLVQHLAKGGKVKDTDPGMEPNEVKAALAPVIAAFGKNSPIVSIIEQWLGSIKEANFSQKALSERIDKAVKSNVLSGAQQHDALAPLVAAFGKHSPITDAIRDWLDQAKAGTVTQQAILDHLRVAVAHVVNPALKEFNVGPGMTAKDAKGEMHDLTKTLEQAFGRDAKWLTHIDALGDHIVAMTKRQDGMQKELLKSQDDLKDTIGKSNEMQKNVAGSINNEIFGNGLDAMSLQLRADTADNKRMLKALRTAKKKGLDGGLFSALAQSGDFGTAQELAGMTRKQIHEYELMFKARNTAQTSLGRFASDTVYAKSIAEQTHHVKHMSNRVDHMTKRIDHLEHGLERAVERGAKQGIRSIGHRVHVGTK